MELELHEVELRYAALRRRDAKRERAVLASLTDAGQQAPVVVVRELAGAWVLVDGYKRVRALKRLHRDTVTAVAWALTEVEALLLTRLMRTAEGDSALEQGWLLRELHERFALSCGELARRFDKSESWVSESGAELVKKSRDYAGYEPRPGRRAAWVERAPGRLEGEPTTRLMIVLRARGCAWARRAGGGGTMCGFDAMTTGGSPSRRTTWSRSSTRRWAGRGCSTT